MRFMVMVPASKSLEPGHPLPPELGAAIAKLA